MEGEKEAKNTAVEKTENAEPVKEQKDETLKKKKDNRYDLNDEDFDYIIFGTGLTESIIGASLAMNDKKCLFLDVSDKYGGTICNFNFEKYLEYSK